MDRDELKDHVDELMRQYGDEEIDGQTYMKDMMDLASSWSDENDDQTPSDPSDE